MLAKFVVALVGFALVFTIAPSGVMAQGRDRAFVVAAEQAGNTEIAEGRVAQMRGNSSTVRSLGARMVRDHTRAAQQLVRIAREQGLPVTMSLGADGASQLAALQSLHARTFDRAYVVGNVNDHRKVIALFQAEIAGGSNAVLRTWARQTLPTLRMHLMLFQEASASGVSLIPNSDEGR